ncbi:dihydrodipicolinate reductase, family protein [Mycobacterium xenopi 4042]|uniref:Dihydrodipicolinate reductase, family protein n=1 Tax=Mycobacterium xenopi 4042 TaxID=1299334 RepID=X8DDP7_MYCXE|nr:dihydrodipicolinate reductase, family protein [Mycobacterium xenopi 4042]
MSKRVVVWGTGFVGKLVIAEIVKHPLFELVGVGVSNPPRWVATSATSAG